jgi:hypothetical protein
MFDNAGSEEPRAMVAGEPLGNTAGSNVIVSAPPLALALAIAPRRLQSPAAPVQELRNASDVVSTVYGPGGGHAASTATTALLMRSGD